ncbi:hypothetical protein KZC51_01900 [Microbacterium sp. SSW1-49]|uniref:Spermidine/putrescine ABC transporter permease n=1 Tax=Microbacterium croceum TaxID=2851645 RepID=A0ABT0FAY4_9MICO|nr:hypothetical protein [Microbacterium croceum]MCK2034877.1 hypothetical protein [Microbacterium croceum]
MDAVDEELRTLRARAYGPHPDIADDPAAVRRLHELEGLRSARRAESMSADAAAPVEAEVVPAGVRMPDEPAPGPSALDALFPAAPELPSSTELPASPHLPASAEHPVAAEAAITPQEPAGPRRYRRRTLWIAAATAAALSAGVTYAVVSFAPVSASSGAPQISTLAPTTTIDVPAGFMGAVEDSPAFEFHGLTLFLSASGFNGPATPDAACLMAVTSDQIPAAEDFTTDSWGVEGPIYSGCRVGVFPATIEVPLTADAPPELRAAFPDGTALQFVLDGDRVGVFLDSE